MISRKSSWIFVLPLVWNRFHGKFREFVYYHLFWNRFHGKFREFEYYHLTVTYLYLISCKWAFKIGTPNQFYLFVLHLHTYFYRRHWLWRRPLFAFIQRRLIFGQNYAKLLDNIRSNFRTKLGPIWSFTWYSLWFVCARTTR